MRELERFFRSRWDEILVTGIFLQSIIAAIYTFNPLIMLTTALIGLLLLALVFSFASRRKKLRPPVRGQSEAFNVGRRALLFTVGFQPATIRLALDIQKPEYVGFICSFQTEKVVSDIVEAYGFTPNHYKKEIVDPQNLVEIRTQTGLILDWMRDQGLAPLDIAVDITGGMTTMSVAVFSQTEERRIDSQYIRSQYDAQNKVIEGTQEAVFASHYLGSATWN